jgi:hypothetical protein
MRLATCLGWTIAVVSTAMAVTMAQAPAPAQEAPTIQVWWDLGVVPRAGSPEDLLVLEPVQQELKLTDAQKKEQAAIEERRFARIRQAGSDTRGRAKFFTARDAIFKETAAATRTILEPGQWERLDQISLQAQGPFAFAYTERLPMASAAPGGPPLVGRLKLSDEQVKRIRAIVDEGDKAIEKAASYTVPIEPKAKPSSTEDLRKLVDSPEFQAAREKAIRDGREARAAVIRRIEEVLTEPQRQAYHKMLGQPFDLSLLVPGGPERRRQIELNMTAQALGLLGGQGGGQRSDPNFNAKVAHPAYAGGPTHPRVLFDEAHHNFHTASGRYKPFAELITNDGYQVIPNKEKFTRDVLSKGDILVIANALGAEGMGADGAANPAFTDAECDSVRDWVKDGGALLLITDHAPMGSAAECLAKRFGVNMSKGAVGDPVNSEEGATSLVFSRQNHLLGDHPITRGRDDSERVNKVRTFTGTSLKGPEGSVAILKLADTAVDYSFRDDNKTVSAAGRAQGLAFPFGQGRVVVMGEAAELSAQVTGVDRKMGMNVPGIDNRQMALNILHWLSGLLEPREAALKKAG